MNEVPWWASLIVAWLPFLVLIGAVVWLTITLRWGLHTRDGRSLAQVADKHAREIERANILLQDAIEAQRRRFEALERKS